MHAQDQEPTISFTPDNSDSIVRAVMTSFMERSTFGRNKYGTDLDRDDLSFQMWLQHAQEEQMDAVLYLEKIKTEVHNKCGTLSGMTPSSVRLKNEERDAGAGWAGVPMDMLMWIVASSLVGSLVGSIMGNYATG